MKTIHAAQGTTCGLPTPSPTTPSKISSNSTNNVNTITPLVRLVIAMIPRATPLTVVHVIIVPVNYAKTTTNATNGIIRLPTTGADTP